MQAVPSMPQQDPSSMSRKMGYLFMVPIATFVLAVLLFAIGVVSYQSRHSNKVYTGVSVADVDVSRLSRDEAQVVLSEQLGLNKPTVMLKDEYSGQTYTFTPAELGLNVDWESTLDDAYLLGRRGGAMTQLQDMFQVWYYGRSVSPTYILNEGQLNAAIAQISNEINRPAINAEMVVQEDDFAYQPGQSGRALDVAMLKTQLETALLAFEPTEIELLVHDVTPTVADTQALAVEVDRMFTSPITFYLQTPLDEEDLAPVVLPKEELVRWLRVTVDQGEDGRFQHNVFVDENALAQWLSTYEDEIYRDPVNARFYFDDHTRELILVAPDINGRELDIAATIDLFQEQIKTANRSIPFITKDIQANVHQDLSATDLGITELVTQTTTWFRGSSPERKHNIARAAANFFGVVIEPGEEFSFNKYLGSISEADGYEQGFVIIGGQAVEGIGGGVCQVSTTLYQTAFNAGFPITERWAHGYMLNYYNDGEGPGMDATIYSPIVDIKFLNNTPYHLLIENYYSTENEALTFKFYSTSLGRRVEKEMLPWQSVTDVPDRSQDVWEYNPDLEEGEVVRIDWATEGAVVTVQRTVYNADGQPLYGTESFVSNYIPIPNTFQYGPGVEPYDYSKVPDDY